MSYWVAQKLKEFIPDILYLVELPERSTSFCDSFQTADLGSMNFDRKNEWGPKENGWPTSDKLHL